MTNRPSPHKKPLAVIYCRCSPRPQDDTASLNVQEDYCREWCGKRGYEVLGVFVDSKSSGKALDRPNFEKAIKLVKERHCMLVAYDLSRISRATKDLLYLIDELNQEGATISTTQEEWVDGTTPMGRMVLTFLSGVNQYFREYQAQKTSEARAARAKNGVHVGGILPWGHWDTGDLDELGRRKVAKDEEMLRIKDWICWRRQEGWSITACVRELEVRGYQFLMGAGTGKRYRLNWNRTSVANHFRTHCPTDIEYPPIRLDAFDEWVIREVKRDNWEWKHWDNRPHQWGRTTKPPLVLHKAMVPDLGGRWPNAATRDAKRYGVDLVSEIGQPAMDERGRLVLMPEEIKPLQKRLIQAYWRHTEIPPYSWPELRIPESFAKTPQSLLIDGFPAEWEPDAMQRLING